MSLAYTALRFIDRVRKNPTDGSDPRMLDILEKAAINAFEGIVALTAPASPMSWECNVNLLGTVQESNRVSFRYPRPVEIVGFYPTLVVFGANGALLTPSLDSISVSIDTDNQNYLTSGEGVSSNAGGTAGPYVTLSAMSVQVPRVLGYKLKNPTPVIGFKFRWKQATTAVAPIYNDTLISMAMFARYL
jgi:hypothetical protein